MTALAPHLTTFLCKHLPAERGSSPHTCDTYAYCFQLLVCFAAARLGIKPSQIEVEQLDAPLVLAFLEYLEQDRKNAARTRNARLAAIHAFFRFLEYRLASSLDQSRQIHAIPMKKIDEALVAYLTRDELRALLDAPDPRVIAGCERSRHVASRLRRGASRLRARGTSARPTRPTRPTDASEHPHHRQRTTRTPAAALEGNHNSPSGLARGSLTERGS